MEKFFYLIVLLILSGCTKEKIIEKSYRWKKHPAFIYNNAAITNSHATYDRFYLIGEKFCSLTDSELSNDFNLASWSKLNGDFDFNHKFPISDLVYLNFDKEYIYATPVNNPMNSDTYLKFSIKKRDNDFSYYEFSGAGESFGINSLNQILIPYRTGYNEKTGSYHAAMTFLFINTTSQRQDNIDFIDTISTSVFKIPTCPGVDFIFSKDDYFILGLGKTYRINSSGIFSLVHEGRFEKVFQKNDTLYGVEYEGLFCSTNNGKSWFKISDLELNPEDISTWLMVFHYYDIENEIIASSMDRLFHISIQDNKAMVKEIDNDGLLTNYITSVSKFKENVYVTTLTGVYYISYKEFFNYKY